MTSASQAARQALEGDGTPTDAADALQRAALGLAAREQELRQDQQLARMLAQLAERQQAASESIATTRQQLATAPSDPEAMSPEQRARILRDGSSRFFNARIRRIANGRACPEWSTRRDHANHGPKGSRFQMTPRPT